jgi:hypothetical protein
MCKIDRSTLKHQSIYLNSQILIEMLNSLYFLFNDNFELDAYIAIEAISVKADGDLMVDVLLVIYINMPLFFAFKMIKLFVLDV